MFERVSLSGTGQRVSKSRQKYKNVWVAIIIFLLTHFLKMTSLHIEKGSSEKRDRITAKENNRIR
tara:strand:- start:1000 stop:1194 length:195 start_codon:yes stop_codon:yes gene_type:complete